MKGVGFSTYSTIFWTIVWDTDNHVTSLPSPAIESEGKRCFVLGHPLFPFNLKCWPSLPFVCLSAGKREQLRVSQPACQRTGQDRAVTPVTQDESCFVQCSQLISDLPEGQQEEGRADDIEQRLRPSPGQTWNTAAVVVIYAEHVK